MSRQLRMIFTAQSVLLRKNEARDVLVLIIVLYKTQFSSLLLYAHMNRMYQWSIFQSLIQLNTQLMHIQDMEQNCVEFAVLLHIG